MFGHPLFRVVVLALVWSFAMPVRYARADEVTAGLAQAHEMMQKGAYVKAIDIITNIIASGKAQADMAAKALLMRGQAREKLGRQAFALADYNQALWMQGLSEADKELAEAGKARIQGGLGVDEPTKKMVSEVSSPQKTSLSSPSVSPTASYSSPPSPSPQSSPPSPSPQSSPAPAPAHSLASGSTSNTVATSMRTTSLGFDQSPPPQESGSSRSSRSGGGIGGFFSSLFGGSETSTSPRPENTAVAVVSPQPRTPFQQEQNSSSSSVTSTSPTNEPSWDSRTAQASTASTGSYVDNLSGHFAIQFAALLSEDKAIYEVNRVTRRYGQALDGRSPSIRIIGTRDGDTLYKIVAGPYETMVESTAKCNELKTVGVQCMVISVK
jgi:hypothetical protein